MLGRIMAVLVAAVLVPAVVFADPSPANSTLPQGIVLVGKYGSDPDPAGLFDVVVRDAANVPILGAKVLIEFGGCGQLTIGSEQTYPGVTLEQCNPPAVSALTDATGTARFVVLGGVANRGAPEPIGPCGVVRASVGADPPVQLGMVRVAAFDQDGINGLDGIDVDLFLQDVFLGTYRQRSDFDGDGLLTLTTDMSLMQAAVCAGRSHESAPRCDGVLANNPGQAAVGGELYLAWNDCRGGGGVGTKTSVCLSNSGSQTLVASFQAPAGVNTLIGFDAELEVVGDPGVALPDWWRFDTPAGCRRTGALTVSGDFTGGPFGCPEFTSSGTGCPTVVYPTAAWLINQQRIRLRWSVPSVALTAGQEYSLLRFLVNNSKTIGLGSCAGCSAPVALVLQSLRLRQSADPDLAMNITSGSSGAVAFWQGVPSGFSITDVPGGSSSTDWLALPAPNPSAGGIQARFGLARESRVSLAVYDLAGRRVRVLEAGTLPAGEHHSAWDGRSERGELLGGGVFFLRLATADRVLTRPVVRIR